MPESALELSSTKGRVGTPLGLTAPATGRQCGVMCSALLAFNFVCHGIAHQKSVRKLNHRAQF